MMKKRLAVLALVLLPLAASAQQPVPLRVPLAGPGTVRFPVKTISFIAYVRGPADEAGALAAMRAAGIDDAVIGPVGSNISLSGQNGSGATSLRGTVRDVTPAKLERIAQAAASYVRSHPGSAVENVNFAPRLDDCIPHEQTARAAALTDARRKAQAVADLAGVTIEGVLSVGESGGCPVSSEPPFGNSGPFDISTLTTTVTVFENVTYSIVQGSPAARRRTL
jgi:hypothetical protein